MAQQLICAGVYIVQHTAIASDWRYGCGGKPEWWSGRADLSKEQTDAQCMLCGFKFEEASATHQREQDTEGISSQLSGSPGSL